jgi:hypothetical protein
MKNLPPPAPIELTPEQIEWKLQQEAQEAEKREKQRRLDEARKRLGELTPELIADVRLLVNDYFQALVAKDKGCGIPEASLLAMLMRGGQCDCRSFLIHTGELK